MKIESVYRAGETPAKICGHILSIELLAERILLKMPEHITRTSQAFQLCNK